MVSRAVLINMHISRVSLFHFTGYYFIYKYSGNCLNLFCPCACNFLLSALRRSQARGCGFPRFVMGRDQIYPLPSFASLHSPFQNVHQTEEGEGRRGFCSNEIYNSLWSPRHRGSNGLDRYSAVPRPPGMSLSFLAGAQSPSQRYRIYYIWSGGGQELAQ